MTKRRCKYLQRHEGIVQKTQQSRNDCEDTHDQVLGCRIGVNGAGVDAWAHIVREYRAEERIGANDFLATTGAKTAAALHIVLAAIWGGPDTTLVRIQFGNVHSYNVGNIVWYRFDKTRQRKPSQAKPSQAKPSQAKPRHDKIRQETTRHDTIRHDTTRHDTTRQCKTTQGNT